MPTSPTDGDPASAGRHPAWIRGRARGGDIYLVDVEFWRFRGTAIELRDMTDVHIRGYRLASTGAPGTEFVAIPGCIGIHLAGNTGGVWVHDCDLTVTDTCILVERTGQRKWNRELFLSGGDESVGINRHETADERAVRGRASHPPRPRVMRRVLVTGWRSVDRGAQAGLLSFERNGFQVLLLWCQGGGKIGCDAKGEWQSDLAESREPGEREVSWTRTERLQHRPLVMVGGTAGEGKSVIPVCTVLGSRTDP